MPVSDDASVQFTANTDLLGVLSFSALSIQLNAQPYSVILPLFLKSSIVTTLNGFATTGTMTPAGSWGHLELASTPLTFTITQVILPSTMPAITWTQVVFQLTSAGTPTVGTFKLTDVQPLLDGQTGTCTFFRTQPLA